MSKQDPYRFNLRFDADDEEHQEVCKFLNACGRKKTRYIVKAFQAYWGRVGAKVCEQAEEALPEIEKEKQEKDTTHFVSIDTEDYSTDQAEVSLMMKNYQMFDSLGKDDET